MSSAHLSDQAVIAGFHSIVQDSLAQAWGEYLLSDTDLETGDVDVQTAGPALALFFGALGSQILEGAPTISTPDGSFILTSSNCPESFQSFFRLWQSNVVKIKALKAGDRHDLSLMLCDKTPVGTVLNREIGRMAADLKSVAIEITQRRTFQEHFQADLQHALESNVRPRTSGEHSRHSSYAPPPEYNSADEIKIPPTSPTFLPHNPFTLDTNSQSSLSLDQQSNLAVIRETLYSAMADVLVSTPSILALLSRGSTFASRAFFASTSLSILEVCLSRVDPFTSSVKVVNIGISSPKMIGFNETPEYLRGFLRMLGEITRDLREIEEEDDQIAMEYAVDGREGPEPRIDRLRQRLENGAGEGDAVGSGTASVNNTVAYLAEKINRLALDMVALPAFKERQTEAFKVLASITSL